MKAKKILISLALVAIIGLSSFVLFSCGKSVTNKAAYDSFSKIITQIKNEDVLIHERFDSQETDFYLNNFVYKASSIQTNEGYSSFQYLASSGLNFIDKYYVLIEDSLAKKGFSDLDSSANKLQKSYDTLKKESESQKEALAKNVAGQMDDEILNGYFYNLRRAAVDFINDVYNCVNQLGQFLIKNENYTASLDTDAIKTEELQFYFDFNIMQIMQDFKNFFFNSCNAMKLSSQDFVEAENNLKDYYAESYKTVKSNVTASKMAQYKTIIENLEGSRDDVNKALSEFSFYYYETKFNNLINAYLKEKDTAQIMYDRAVDYFCKENCVLDLARVFLNNNIAN